MAASQMSGAGRGCRSETTWGARAASGHTVLLGSGRPRERGRQGLTDGEGSPLLLDGCRGLLPFAYLPPLRAVMAFSSQRGGTAWVSVVHLPSP